MFGKKKEAATTPETAEQPADNTVQFEKNIKTLWIYTTLFCLFALVLIVVSSVIQSKINSRAEYYQDQYENTKTTSQSAIKNIRDENEALKKDLESYKSRAEALEAQTESDAALLNAASLMVENAEYLAKAQSALSSGNTEQARAYYRRIAPDKLSAELVTVYESLKARLG